MKLFAAFLAAPPPDNYAPTSPVSSKVSCPSAAAAFFTAAFWNGSWSSNPMALRPDDAATERDLPVPQNGSSTVPPDGQEVRIRGLMRSVGKVAECPSEPERACVL